MYATIDVGYFYINIVYPLLSTSTCYLNYLLGHIGSVQEPVLLLDPTQFAPPYWGAGFVHVLLLLLDPVSHVTEHEPHEPHPAQLPLTEIEGQFYIYCKIIINMAMK